MSSYCLPPNVVSSSTTDTLNKLKQYGNKPDTHKTNRKGECDKEKGRTPTTFISGPKQEMVRNDANNVTDNSKPTQYCQLFVRSTLMFVLFFKIKQKDDVLCQLSKC